MAEGMGRCPHAKAGTARRAHATNLTTGHVAWRDPAQPLLAARGWGGAACWQKNKEQRGQRKNENNTSKTSSSALCPTTALSCKIFIFLRDLTTAARDRKLDSQRQHLKPPQANVQATRQTPNLPTSSLSYLPARL
jgi:hypothetical protein